MLAGGLLPVGDFVPVDVEPGPPALNGSLLSKSENVCNWPVPADVGTASTSCDDPLGAAAVVVVALPAVLAVGLLAVAVGRRADRRVAAVGVRRRDQLDDGADVERREVEHGREVHEDRAAGDLVVVVGADRQRPRGRVDAQRHALEVGVVVVLPVVVDRVGLDVALLVQRRVDRDLGAGSGQRVGEL